MRRLTFPEQRERDDTGFEGLPYVDGGLFERAGRVRLNSEQLALLVEATSYNSSGVDPTIFGSLMEACLGHAPLAAWSPLHARVRHHADRSSDDRRTDAEWLTRRAQQGDQPRRESRPSGEATERGASCSTLGRSRSAGRREPIGRLGPVN